MKDMKRRDDRRPMRDMGRRRPVRDEERRFDANAEENENQIEGRNALTEALRSGRDRRYPCSSPLHFPGPAAVRP